MTSRRMMFVQYIKLNSSADFESQVHLSLLCVCFRQEASQHSDYVLSVLSCKDPCGENSKLSSLMEEWSYRSWSVFQLLGHLLAWYFSCCLFWQCCVMAGILFISPPYSPLYRWCFWCCVIEALLHVCDRVFRRDFTRKNYTPLVYSSRVTFSLQPSICEWFHLSNSIAPTPYLSSAMVLWMISTPKNNTPYTIIGNVCGNWLR